jgi:polyisoprenoid-binding protein YceI
MTSLEPSINDLATLAGDWTLDPARTSITFRTKAMWVLPVKGTVTATEGRGTVGADGSVSGTLILDPASISTGMKKRDEHLRTADFFDVAAYPTITYTVSGATLQTGGTFKVSGALQIHGESRPLEVTAEVTVTGTTATVAVETDIDRSAWGISWAKMGAGLANHVVATATFVKA